MEGYTIKIIDVPKGEAPEWVRKEWVGLELPLFYNVPHKKDSCFRAVTGKKIFCSGYSVAASDALNILSKKSTEAFKWWREQSFCEAYFGKPSAHLLFIFNLEACEIVR